MSAALTPVDVVGGAVRAAGILHFEPSITGGHSLHRLPAWTQPQVVDPAFVLMRGMPSGSRFELVTDATTIELDVQMTIIQLGDEQGNGGSFDLVVDGELVDGIVSYDGTVLIVNMETGALDFRPAGPTTIRFDGLPE